MSRSLAEKFEQGRIADEHMVADCLGALDPKAPSQVLEGLPDQVLARAFRFAKEFDHEHMLTTYGAVPTPEQAMAARKWIDFTMRREGKFLA